MDSFDDDPFEPSSSSRDEKGEEAVHDLLEDGWFYGKLLYSRPKMIRCYSDPCPNFCQENSGKNHCTEKSLLTRKGPGNLIRAPSLPPCTGREEKIEEKFKSCAGMSKLTRQFSDMGMVQKPSEPTRCSNTKKKGEIQDKGKQGGADKKNTGQSSRHNLLRRPSLPPCIGRQFDEDVEDDESDATMSRLIREAMPNSLPVQTRHHGSKGTIQDSNLPMSRPSRSSAVEVVNNNTDRPKERRQYPGRVNSMKSIRDLEFQEVQGFRDLGFTFETKELNPSVIEVLPGLQEKEKEVEQSGEKSWRPYLSEAWHVQSCATPFPIWAASSSRDSAADMKAQLKFWARAVASNVR